MPISLFYHYTLSTPDLPNLRKTLLSVGEQLNLSGRCRISAEGINCTCGTYSDKSLDEFHSRIRTIFKADKIHFKISTGSPKHFPEGWVVRIVKELVTLGAQVSWRDAAPHILSHQFRRQVESCEHADDVVLLDVRNGYEHAIGHFRGALLPPLRQFSDLPAYITEHRQLFVGKKVVMYCTGGIRCESASAYVKHHCDAVSVTQLYGGIEAFLNEFPDGGGVWNGKNLVFDKRMAVAKDVTSIVGRCFICNAEWDDYSRNIRCTYCRVRVLICPSESCLITYQTRALCCQCKQRGRQPTPAALEDKIQSPG